MSKPEDDSDSALKLDGTNYELWKFQLRIVLESHQLLQVVDGVEECPKELAATASAQDVSEREKAVKAWKLQDAKARKFITKSMEPKQLATILTCATAAAMWERIQAIHEEKSEDKLKSGYHLARFFSYEGAPHEVSF